MRERVRKLESAMADQYIAQEIDKPYLEIACERAGIDDVEAFKKSRWQARHQTAAALQVFWAFQASALC